MTPPSDMVIIAVIVAIAPTIASVAALVQVFKVHKLVNSRMTELLDLTRKSSLAEGRADRESI